MEIKKLIINKFNFIAISVWIVFLLMYRGIGLNAFRDTGIGYSGKLYKQYEGRALSEELYKDIERDFNNKEFEAKIFGENVSSDLKSSYYHELINKIDSANKTQEYRQILVDNASKILMNNTYNAKLALLTKDLYSQKVEYNMYDYLGPSSLLEFMNGDYGIYVDLATIFLIIILCCNVFVIEHESNMYKVVVSTKYGRSKLFKNKFFISLICATILSVVQILLYALMMGCIYGYNGIFEDIQNLSDYYSCPFDLNIFETIIIAFVLRTIAYQFVAAVTCVISTIFKKSTMPLIVTSVIIVGILCKGYECSNYYDFLGNIIEDLKAQYVVIKQFSCLSFLYDNKGFLTGIECYNIFGQPILSVWWCSVVRILEIIGLYFIGKLCYKYRFRIKGTN